MTEDKDKILKVVFGLIIFSFSLALAYFTATYTDKNTPVNYWATLLLFMGIYLVVGLVVARIYPISLGFLFSADILLLNTLFEKFDDLDNIIKLLIVWVILVVLYTIAWVTMSGEEEVISLRSDAPPTVPPASTRQQ